MNKRKPQGGGRANKGLKKVGCRHLMVNGTEYRWKVIYYECCDDDSVHTLLKRENPGQRVITHVGGNYYKYQNECYAKYALCVDAPPPVISLKDMCSLQIVQKGINYMTKKVPKDLQQYIISLDTKLVLLETNVPYRAQVTPKMVRAVVLGALACGWNPSTQQSKQFPMSLDECCFYPTKEDLDFKINSNPSLHSYKNYLTKQIHNIT